MTARKPDAIHKVQNTFRKDRHLPGLEVAPLGQIPAPPPDLSEDGAATWREMAVWMDKYGLLTPLDLNTFKTYCTLDSYIQEYERQIAKDKVVQFTKLGKATTNNFLSQYMKLVEVRDKIGQRFGFTPMDRQKMHPIKPANPCSNKWGKEG